MEKAFTPCVMSSLEGTFPNKDGNEWKQEEDDKAAAASGAGVTHIFVAAFSFNVTDGPFFAGR